LGDHQRLHDMPSLPDLTVIVVALSVQAPTLTRPVHWPLRTHPLEALRPRPRGESAPALARWTALVDPSTRSRPAHSSLLCSHQATQFIWNKVGLACISVAVCYLLLSELYLSPYLLGVFLEESRQTGSAYSF